MLVVLRHLLLGLVAVNGSMMATEPTAMQGLSIPLPYTQSSNSPGKTNAAGPLQLLWKGGSTQPQGRGSNNFLSDTHSSTRKCSERQRCGGRIDLSQLVHDCSLEGIHSDLVQCNSEHPQMMELPPHLHSGGQIHRRILLLSTQPGPLFSPPTSSTINISFHSTNIIQYLWVAIVSLKQSSQSQVGLPFLSSLHLPPSLSLL